MSGRLRCYKQQQHPKLLAQFVFKVSAFRFNTCHGLTAVSIMCWSSLSNNNVMLTQALRSRGSKVGKFSDIACIIISCLVVGIFMRKNSTVTKLCPLALGSPVIMPHRVYVKTQATKLHFRLAESQLHQLVTFLFYLYNIQDRCENR